MTTTSTVQRVDADEALLACTTLSRVDHVDVHTLSPTSALQTPEAWARIILEGPPAATRLRLRAGWTMLGLRLHRGDADVIAGWRITHRDTEYLRLQASSALGLTGELVTRVTDDHVVFATLVRLGNPAARLLWARVLPTHLTVVRSLLEGAAARTC